VISDDERLDVMSGRPARCSAAALYSADGQADHPASGRRLRRATCSGIAPRRAAAVPGDRRRASADRLLARCRRHRYALVRLYDVTGERSYLEAAVEGIDFERSVFVERRAIARLPAVRRRRPRRTPVKWCHGSFRHRAGAPGLQPRHRDPGLERERSTPVSRDPRALLQEAISSAAATSAGRDVCSWRGAVTGDPELQATRRRRHGERRRASGADGCYRLFGAAGSYNPGFFHGTAGIGYQLLRQADRGCLVLLWE